jgi:lipopolysaccharide export system permease protein
MRILDKQILKSIFTIFFVTVLTFCCLYILIDSTGKLDEIIDRNVPFSILIKYYLSFFPIILVQTSSIACLISVLFTFTALNNNNEIIALRASGMSFWQITKPAIFFGLLISICIFAVNEQFVPKAMERTQQIKVDNLALKADREEKKKAIRNLTFYGLKNRLFFIDSYDHTNFELKGINILEYDKEQNITQKIVALKGNWTGIAWKFYNIQITTFDYSGLKPIGRIKPYQEKLMDIKETPEDLLKQQIKVTSMNIRELNEYISKFKSSGAERAINNLKVDFHQKIAYPFANFVIILVGLPFALFIQSRKRSTFSSLGIAIAIGFLFYVTDAVAIALGKGGALPPLLSAWMGPMIFSGIAILLIEKNF